MNGRPTTATRRPIIPNGQEVLYERFHLAPAFPVGQTVYVAGVIGRGPDGVPNAAVDEFALAFAQLATTLEAAGASMSDIVELTSFHTDMGMIGDFATAKDAVIGDRK